MKKIVKLDIEISDFFELNYFQFDGGENDYIQENLKFNKVLMSASLGEELLGICKNGGITLYLFYISLF